MIVGYYPGWDSGFVDDAIKDLKRDGQRKKAAAKLEFDLQMLVSTWPLPKLVTVSSMKGREPLRELSREYQGIAYRVFFCVKDDEIWLLHSIEKKTRKTPGADLDLAHTRMKNVLSGKVRRIE